MKSPISEEIKLKMRLAHLGKKLSEETRRKISEARKGKCMGENHWRWKGGLVKRICQVCGKSFEVYPCVIRIEEGKYCSKKCAGVARKTNPLIMAQMKRSGEAKKGKPTWILGKHHSEESNRKNSEAHKGKPAWNKGLTVETSESVRRTFEKLKGRKLTKDHVRKILTRRTPSSLEEKFLGIINKYNLPYKFTGDGSFMIENCNPDFINVNGDKIAIEVYARFYKNLRFGNKIDEWKKDRANLFMKYGWKIIYFDETEVSDDNVLHTLSKPEMS